MNRVSRHQHIAVALLLAALAYALQVIPLLWGRPFAVDWVNHVWMIQYSADYLTSHGRFPTTLDAQQAFGNPSPIFYGVFFYPLISLLAVATGADIALRIFSAAMLLAPVFAISMLLKPLTGNRSTALLLAVVANSSVYQMTNLYTRSAIPEFFASQFLLVGLALCLHGLVNRSAAARASILLGSACVAIAAGTHPITLYTFALFAAPVAALGLIAIRKEIASGSLLLLVGLAVLTALVMTPWLVIVATNKAGLQVTTTDILAGTLHLFPSSVDSALGRIGFGYFDPRVAEAGIRETSTPFLDAPFSVPLAILFAYVSYRNARSSSVNAALSIVPAIVSAAVLLCAVHAPNGAPAGIYPGSVTATADDGILYRLLIPIQFAYRLAGTWNLTLLTAVVIGLIVLRREANADGKGLRTIALVAALLSLVALSQKLYTTGLVFLDGPADWSSYSSTVAKTKSYPTTYYGLLAYSTPGDLEPTPSSPNLSSTAVLFTKWGEQAPVHCSEACMLRTNLLPSPGNRLLVDGEAPQAATISSGGTLDFVLPAGTHEVRVDKVGGRFLATQISIWVTLGWFIAALVYAAWTVVSLRSPVVEAGRHAMQTARQ